MEKQLRCISWIATSSQPQAERESPADQRRRNLEVIERLGGELVAELEVPGQSRSIIVFDDAAKEIDAYAELRRLLDSRAADMLVFRDMSRLGRKASLSLQVVELCHDAGVALYDRSSPPQALTAAEQSGNDASLITNSIQGAFAQIEIRNLVRRHEYGMTGRIKAGKLPGRIPYGYIKRFLADGTQTIAIDAAQALVVQEIFDLYLLNYSLNEISQELTRRGVSTPAGRREWQYATVRDIIKRCYIYAGFTEWRRSGDKQMIRAQGNHEPIISLATAKSAERDFTQRTYKRRPGNQFLLNRVLICARCGNYLAGGSGESRSIYRCYDCERQGRGSCSISEGKVMSDLAELVHRLYNGRNLSKIVKATQVDESVDHFADQIELAIIQVERERDRIIYAYQNAAIEHEDLVERVEPLNKRRDDLRRQLANLQANIGPNETYQERMERLQTAVEAFDDILDKMSTPEANRLLRRNFRIYIEPRRVDRIEVL